MRGATLTISLLAAVLAGGCSGERIAPETAAGLVAQSRAVEARLVAGDRCGADERASQLVRLADRAISAERVPVELATELRSRAARLASTLTCPPSPAPTPPAVVEDGKEGGEDDEGEGGPGKGRGKKKGHE